MREVTDMWISAGRRKNIYLLNTTFGNSSRAKLNCYHEHVYSIFDLTIRLDHRVSTFIGLDHLSNKD